MCQMNVLIEKGGGLEKVMDEVTRLEVTDDGVLLSTFFSKPKLIPGCRIKNIDFMGTSVTLQEAPAGGTGQ